MSLRTTASKKRKEIPTDQLRALWFDAAFTIRDIAREFGVSGQLIAQRARHAGLPSRRGFVVLGKLKGK